MLPILFRAGPITIYSFGLFLGIAVLVASFFVWKKSRENALPDEKMIDIFILTLVALIASGRLFYVFFNWSRFRIDLGRIFLLLKYPGVSFSLGLFFAGVFAIFLARTNGLGTWLVLDIFALALSAGSVFGFTGCYLDGCMGAASRMPLFLAIFMLVLTIVLIFFWQKLKNSIVVAKSGKGHGLIFLCYLIFSSLSLLISSYASGKREYLIYGGALVISLFVFTVRYRALIWSNFPTRFYPRLGSILKKDESK